MFRYVGVSGTPAVKNIKWYRTPDRKIISMSWCPEGQHLLVLTGDMTVMLIPVLSMILGGTVPTQTRRYSRESPLHANASPLRRLSETSVSPSLPLDHDHIPLIPSFFSRAQGA